MNLRIFRRALAVCVAAATQGCQSQGEQTYQLRCEAVYAATVAEVVCLRHDTRSGEVARLDLAGLPIASTPADPKATEAGQYTVECATTHTSTTSDMHCVRMNVRTGELHVLAMPRLPIIPEGGGAAVAASKTPQGSSPTLPTTVGQSAAPSPPPPLAPAPPGTAGAPPVDLEELQQRQRMQSGR